MLAGLLLGSAASGLLTASPAAAIDDLGLPDARVTHGPSCRPGGLVVEVVAGTVPYAVRLATTRLPAGEDEAVLEPGQTVVLRTGDVAPGETIDGRLEFTARGDPGTGHVDELAGSTFTRPTTEACSRATAVPPGAGPAALADVPPAVADPADEGVSLAPPLAAAGALALTGAVVASTAARRRSGRS